MLKQSLSIALLLISGGCSFVETTSDSEQVRIIPADRTTGCTRIGTITTSTKASIAGIPRVEDKIIQEVDALAQLEALHMDADTLVPQGPPKEGRRDYVAYRCLE